ncbi:MAG: precorrin-4 C(11)-methyltransferase [Crocosphaera sp.]|nr:precorrin-4 C(11)-methyltransferase [Crocosphaera sp.]
MTVLSSFVYFIGAGPGDPDLLTLKAYKIIKEADVILYANSLVPQQILQNVHQNCELITTGNKTLEEIMNIMINRVKNKKSVVRLHSGDLTLYSAINEQISILIKEKINFELVPGISAFQAAAAKIGTELTIPDLVQTIILTRISGSASQVPDKEELESLAAHQASLCLYLAARHVRKSQEKLLQYYPVDTPVAICFRIGWEDEKIRIVSLENMAEVTEAENLVRTTMYLISPALKTNLNSRSHLYNPQHSHLFRQKK